MRTHYESCSDVTPAIPNRALLKVAYVEVNRIRLFRSKCLWMCEECINTNLDVESAGSGARKTGKSLVSIATSVSAAGLVKIKFPATISRGRRRILMAHSKSELQEETEDGEGCYENYGLLVIGKMGNTNTIRSPHPINHPAIILQTHLLYRNKY